MRVARMALLMLAAACVRGRQGVPDGGIAVEKPDAGPAGPFACDPSAEPATGGLVWQERTVATVSASPAAVWIPASTDTECAALAPVAPPSRLSWSGNADTWCDPAVVDGQGDLALPVGSKTFFFGADSGAGTLVANGIEHRVGTDPLARGFWLYVAGTSCMYRRQVSGEGQPVDGPVFIADGAGEMQLYPNPAGDFVESTWTQTDPSTLSFRLRWANEALQPASSWVAVLTAPSAGSSMDVQVFVDDQGRALVLSFASPPGFGPPPPSSSWNFVAQWIGRDGPIGKPFAPVAPVYVAGSNVIWFAGWGTMLPLPDGGFAAFHDSSAPYPGGSTAPSGWYAAYPGGEARTDMPPSWLQSYGGSIRRLVSGGFAAVRRDPNTCRRTALVISRSGRTCFTLALPGSELCEAKDTIWPDGTLVLQKQNGCETRWWPGLARASRIATH